MAHDSDPRLLTVHGLRLKGFAEPDVIATTMGVDEADAKLVAESLVAEDLAVYREGRLCGYLLTPAGRAHGEELLRAELDETGVRDAIDAAYREFLTLNADLLEICTAWQMREVAGTQQLNDHTDAAYDDAVIGRLVALHDRMRPVVTSLRDQLSRFGGHADRLRVALERLVDGEHEYFTKPMFPSYHTIWFELHEDLLATLGIDRASETTP